MTGSAEAVGRRGTEPRRLHLVLLGVAVGSVLGVFAPLVLVSDTPDVGRSHGWWATLPLITYAGIRLAVLVARGRPQLFDFFLMLFVYIFLGLAPSVQIRSGLISTTTDGMDSYLDLPTAGLVWLGLAAYEAGRLLASLRLRRDGPPRHRRPPDGVSPGRATALLLLGLLLSAYFVVRVGPGTLFAGRDLAFAARNAAFPDPASRSIFYALAIYPLLVGVGATVQLRRSASGFRGRLWGLVGLLSLIPLLLIVNPISSARYSMGTVFFAIAVYLGAMTNRLRTRVTMASTIGAFVFLFPLADAFRYSNRAVEFGRSGFFDEYAGNPDYDAFWQIANSWSYVVDGLVEPGRQALGVALFWVPRQIWPDKPVDTGILLAQYRGYDFDNLSAPLWAEFLVNGGPLALVVGFAVTGVVLRRIDLSLVPAFAASGFWAIVGAVLPVYMTILLRGSLLQATGAVTVMISCMAFVRARSRSSDGLSRPPPTVATVPGSSPSATRPDAGGVTGSSAGKSAQVRTR